MSLLSVVIPTYHTPPVLLRGAIASVLKQNPKPEEVFVVEDGIQPAVPALVRAFDDPSLRLIRLPANAGPLYARRAGIEASRSEFVAFEDADDESLPGRFAAQLDFLRAHKNAAVVSVITQDDAGWQTSPSCDRKILLERENALHGGHCMFRRAAYEVTGGIDALAEWIQHAHGMFLAEDYALWLHMIAAGWDCGCVPRILHRRHRPAGSLTLNFSRECDEAGIELRLLIKPRIKPLRSAA